MDIKELEEIFDIQDRLNIVTNGPEYKNGKTTHGRKMLWDYYITVELGELLDSLNYKHWANLNKKDDIDNLYIELADILCFQLSRALTTKDVVTFDFMSHIVNSINDLDIRIKPLRYKTDILETVAEYNKLLVENNIYINNFSLPAVRAVIVEEFTKLFLIAKKLDIDIPTLINIYKGKVILNEFRQENGYKDNTYIKEWNGVEDNIILTRLLREGNNLDNIKDKLTEEYQKVLNNN